MIPSAVVFLLVNAIALLLLPRRWAAIPVLIGTLYMTRGQAVDFGVVTFTVLRVLIAVGVVRLVLRRELLAGGMNRLDWLIAAWGIWTVASVWFHVDPATQVVLRLRYVFDGWGLYLLFRASCRSLDDIAGLGRALAWILVPFAVLMLLEKESGENPFAMFGSVPPYSVVRANGSVRAQGPFEHSILAGTVGAVCLPLIVGVWPRARWSALAGAAACLAIVFASGSSGPVLSAAAAVAALCAWPLRRHVRAMRWAAVGVYLLLELVMNRPAYFLMTRMDVTGSSTGWYRARLIQSAFRHLNEWWLVGTDYTRHWMPTGVPWSPDRTDITNHYLAMGVNGGLLLMFIFMAMFVVNFSSVGKTMKAPLAKPQLFAAWCAGCMLFTFAVTSISVSYFDNSLVFLYVAFAVTGVMVPAADPAVAESHRTAAPSSPNAAPRKPAAARVNSPFAPWRAPQLGRLNSQRRT